MSSIRFLKPPLTESKHFGKNYIENFIIEFQFPALLEIEQSQCPRVIEIQKSVRKKFPHYIQNLSTQLTPAGRVNEVIHEFRNGLNGLLFSLQKSKASFSTSNYTSFADAKSYCCFLIETVVPQLETDFFTRVGMRYINKLGIDNVANNQQDWVNQNLIVSSEVLGTLSHLKTQCAGNIDQNTNYLFRYGISEEQPKKLQDGKVQFILDYDYSQQDIRIGDVIEVLEKIHDIHYSFFWWSLGEKARQELQNA